MEHEAFSSAGKEPGTEIWNIDNFEPVPVEEKIYGTFYNGNSYIVLQTTQPTSSSPLNHDLHFWLGSASSQDKVGAAAILSITLDNMLNGSAVHHREVQGHESAKFLGYFKPAIRYLEGGTESGFNSVTTNAGAEKRLLKLTGCDNMRIIEVPAEFSSLCRELCFILEVEHDIFVLMPSSAKAAQRRKIISVANKLRDDDHNGRATIEIIDEFSSEEDIEKFFEALGSGSLAEVVERLEEDVYERSETEVYLYKILPGDDIELIPVNKPFKQSILQSSEMYILDTPDSGIFVWIGSAVEETIKNGYYDITQKYLEIKGYPTWLHVTKVSEGKESTGFVQYFDAWDNYSSGIVWTQSNLVDSSSEDIQSSIKLIGKSASAYGYKPDNGDGDKTVHRFAENEGVDISDDFKNILFTAEAYVIQYNSPEGKQIAYFWIGAETTEENIAAAEEFITNLEDENNNLQTIKVPQGKESGHFLAIFQGSLLVLKGGVAKDYQPTNWNDNYEETNTRLFRLEGTSSTDIRVYQVPESVDSLEDDDVMILEAGETVYVRFGKDCYDEEKEATRTFIENKRAILQSDVVFFDQGEETEEFWAALGATQDDSKQTIGWYSTANRRVNGNRILTAVNLTANGQIKFEEVPAFTQEDLSEDGVYLLDSTEEIYVWKGAQVPDSYKTYKTQVLKEYLSDDGFGRTPNNVVLITVLQGTEGDDFKRFFPSWNDALWDEFTSYEDLKTQLKAY